MFPVGGGAGATEAKPPNRINSLDGRGPGAAEASPNRYGPKCLLAWPETARHFPPLFPCKPELSKTDVLVESGFDVDIAAVELVMHEVDPAAGTGTANAVGRPNSS
jgi:hypothetical protein